MVNTIIALYFSVCDGEKMLKCQKNNILTSQGVGTTHLLVETQTVGDAVVVEVDSKIYTQHKHMFNLLPSTSGIRV